MSQYVPCRECGKVVNRYLELCPYCKRDPGGDRSDRPDWAAPDAVEKVRYQPLQGVAVFLQLLFGLFILASILGLLTAIPYRSNLLEVAAGASSFSDQALLAEDRYNAASSLMGYAYLATAVSFIVWFSRAYSNLTFLGRPRRRRPVWAVGAWFIPFAGMVIPYGIGAEIWTQSKPEPGPLNEYRDANMEPVISWWALFLIMSVVNVLNGLMLPEDYELEDLAAYVGVDVVAALVSVAAAVAAIRFVRRATARQEKLYLVHQSGLRQ